ESRRRWQRENWRRAAVDGLEPLAWDAEQWERRTAEALAEQRANRAAELEQRNRELEAKRLQDQLVSLVEAAFPNVLNRNELVGAIESADSSSDRGATESALDELVAQRRLFMRPVPGGTAYLLQEEQPEGSEISRSSKIGNKKLQQPSQSESGADRWSMGRVVSFNRANFADLQLLRRARPTVAMVTRLMCEKRALDAVTLDKESFV
uniref:Cyclic nucleotide-binding domain-containing protein n=1 Tax=Macrostomum lignano TaxID=282301 RepID=A0A1I8HKU0_9PLAT